ncbi:MAG: ferredoxin reductase family protein [Saprospiraceae bacterium]
MKFLKQELYFPIIIAIHFGFWAIDLYFYNGTFLEVSSDTLLFGELTNVSWQNMHRILGEVFSSWVVTVFAFNFLMATRAKWVERIFGGLDKMYLIHRRSGVIAVFLLLAHFIVVPRDLTAFTPGKPLGFYAFVLILLGVLISAAPIFKRKIPYHKWLNVHKLMGLFYVMGVVHGLMVRSLIQELPITRVYVFGMAFIGIAAWIYRAFLFGIFNKKLTYQITNIQNLGHGMSEVLMKPMGSSLNYLAGQFAFFKFPTISKKEQHPFTISSHPDQKNLRITVKGLGDYTNEMHTKIKVGDEVSVEGPYGHFSSKYIQEKAQTWIAGGIGITPFLSLAQEANKQNIHLFWCVKNESEAVYAQDLEAISQKHPNFKYTIWASEKSGYLTANQLEVRDFESNAFLICGPATLKDSMSKQLKEKGVSSEHIYDEEFAFR